MRNANKIYPTMPRTIGIVTSTTGAVIRDIMSTLGRRFPFCTAAYRTGTGCKELVQAATVL